MDEGITAIGRSQREIAYALVDTLLDYLSEAELEELICKAFDHMLNVPRREHCAKTLQMAVEAQRY